MATTPSPHLYTYSASFERRTGLKISSTSNVTTGTLSIRAPQEITLRAKTPRPLRRTRLISINWRGRRGIAATSIACSPDNYLLQIPACQTDDRFRLLVKNLTTPAWFAAQGDTEMWLSPLDCPCRR